jgi:3-oxo-5-alpha-steroid 4-dehydrogenase 1
MVILFAGNSEATNLGITISLLKARMASLSISYSTLRLFMYGWIALAVIIFLVLQRITAPYGRHASDKWGPVVANRWGWLIMEIPVLLALALTIYPCAHSLSAPSWCMIGLFYYLNRALIYPFRLHTKGKTMPWVVVGAGVLFNLVSGFSLGYYFGHFASYTEAWFADPRFVAGLLLFFLGLAINWKADNKLIHLRGPGETSYVIPTGWLFDFISCPNLLGELLEWLGFAILCWNLPSLGFFIWTAANLIPRARSHHRWYKAHFPEYPAKRSAIIPFLL